MRIGRLYFFLSLLLADCQTMTWACHKTSNTIRMTTMPTPTMMQVRRFWWSTHLTQMFCSERLVWRIHDGQKFWESEGVDGYHTEKKRKKKRKAKETKPGGTRRIQTTRPCSCGLGMHRNHRAVSMRQQFAPTLPHLQSATAFALCC